MDFSYSQIIQRLREFARSFSASRKKMPSADPKLAYLVGPRSQLSKANEIPSTLPDPSVNPYGTCVSNISSTQPSSSLFVSPRGNGLGWVPRRSKFATDSEKPSADPISEDHELLEALPELQDSRLIGDHYFLTLSDSDEEDRPPKRKKRLSPSQSANRKSRDPDPTWSFPGTSSHRAHSRCLKSPDRLLPPSSTKDDVAKLSTTGVGLHPLLRESSSAGTSGKSNAKKPLHQKDSSTSQAGFLKQPKTTVRQRLAKRLGL